MDWKVIAETLETFGLKCRIKVRGRSLEVEAHRLTTSDNGVPVLADGTPVEGEVHWISVNTVRRTFHDYRDPWQIEDQSKPFRDCLAQAGIKYSRIGSEVRIYGTES